MIIIFDIVLYILAVFIFRSPDWLAWMRNTTTWFTPSHDSICSWNNHPTACLLGFLCCIVHWSTTGCVWYFSRFFSRSLKSQSQVWFCPLLFLHWYYWSWVCILCSQCSRSTSKWQYWLASYQDALHYIWYSKHYWAAQKQCSEALNMCT